ncbi:ubiquitin thioesterase OTU1 [Nematocida sp. AWRm77]|nr:ubiquitin thioesterase OTU1 [Nematocida sp. AWRm77]
MKFKMIDGQHSFIYEAECTLSVSELYAAVREKTGRDLFIFRSMPRSLVEKSDKPVSEVLADMDCLYLEASEDVQGPTCSEDGLLDKDLVFKIFVVPSDNSCLFHSLSEVLSAKSSGELRKMVANTILSDPKAFAPFIEKDPFAYSKWITNPDIWGGAPEITIISKVYETMVCVIDRSLQPIEFGDTFRSVVYLMYTGAHYNAVVAYDKTGNPVRKFPKGSKAVREKAREAVKEFFSKGPKDES